MLSSSKPAQLPESQVLQSAKTPHPQSGVVAGFLPEILADAGSLLRAAARLAWSRKWPAVLLLVLIGSILGSLIPQEDGFYNRVTAWSTPVGSTLAGKLRAWGRFYDTLFFCGSLYALGSMLRRRQFRTAAVAGLLAALVAGASISAVRGLSGRPRPATQMPDRWQGPTTQYKFQSFPSGHTGTSIACATALLAGAGVIAWPALLSALLIAWACVYNGYHYPSDVCVAIVWGTFVGGSFGLATRQLFRSNLEHMTARASEPQPAGSK